MKPIQIKLGDENRIFIEKNIFHSQLFKEQYEQIVLRLSEYISAASKRGNRVIEEEKDSKENNIFLINGERGAGKSSMLTSLHAYFSSAKDDNVISKKHYLRLKIIDPSSFSNNANILQILIAELFKEFKKKEVYESIGYEAKNELTANFVNIKHALYVLDTQATVMSSLDDSDIESLSDMSNAIQLEDLISILIMRLLEALDKEMLLICIDDIDLNTQHAYEMLEQIRKYLLLPNVVILIAAKMSQLQEVVQQHNIREYDRLLVNQMMTSQEILDISNKYLLKLFPLEHRIDLNPAIRKLQQAISVYQNDKLVAEASNGDELIYRLIYQKTGLQFLLEKDGTNYIVPDNLRAYRLLLKLLCNMNDADKDSNINTYQQYFLNEWVSHNLQTQERRTISELLTDLDVSKVNKKIIMSIVTNLQSGSNAISQIPYPEIVNVANVYTNVSLGDVMAMIIWSKSINSNEQFARYIYAIKHAYTILLEKAYRDMLSPESIDQKIKTYNNSHADEYMNMYQKLVGGALLHGYTWDYLLPSSVGIENRLHRTIQIHQPSDLNILDIIKCLIVTPFRSKVVNEGEGYRRQMATYYLQYINTNTKDVIIDWFNLLYTVPFFIEQMSRFEEGFTIKWYESKLVAELMNVLKKEKYDQITICRTYFGLCIHSVDLLERIYWHIRLNRNYLRTTNNKWEIYNRLLFIIMKAPIDDYISSEEKESFTNLMKVAMGILLQEKEAISSILEGTPQRTLRRLGLPEYGSILKCRTVADLKARMRRINEWKGYKGEWIDSEIDKLGLTDEDMQTQSPQFIRNRLKQISL